MEEDHRLIEQIKLTQSSVASTRLVDKYKGRVFTFCLRMVKERGWAEEIAQDAFIKALDKLDTLQEADKFYPWLMRLAYRVAIDHIRRKRVVLEPIEGAGSLYSSDDPHLEVVNKDKGHLIEQLIAKLPEEDRLILTLFYFEDTEIKDIERITGLSASNIKVKLFRARQVLKKKFEKIMNQL